MLNIDENDLFKLILEERKGFIESCKFDGTGEIISGISIIITLILGDFSLVKFINPIIFQLFAWLTGLCILLHGLVLHIKGRVNFYSAKNLYSDICELDPTVEHAFSIVLLSIPQADGKFLLYKNRRWRSFHFPNYKINSRQFDNANEAIKIKAAFTRDVGINDNDTVIIRYVGDIIDRKFSVGDKMHKKFHFYFYEVSTSHCFKYDNFNKLCRFSYNGKKYKWFTLDQMYKNRRIVKTNKNVLDFVRNQYTLS